MIYFSCKIVNDIKWCCITLKILKKLLLYTQIIIDKWMWWENKDSFKKTEMKAFIAERSLYSKSSRMFYSKKDSEHKDFRRN